MHLLQAKQIQLRLEGTDILRNISLRITTGECLGLLGPSGCGKSTLVRTLLGMLSPDKGSIAYAPSIDPKQAQNQHAIGYVPQDDIVHHSLTTEQALRYALMLRQKPPIDAKEVEQKVKGLMQRLDLTKRANTRIKRLSGGERKRVSLGTELLTDPALLFLDEPTAGLDPHLEREMMKLFRRLVTPERSILVTTHRLANVTLFDTVVFIVQGTLVFGGTPADALSFFQVDSYERIYSKVRLLPPERIAEKFRQSPFYAPFVQRSAPTKTNTIEAVGAEKRVSSPPQTWVARTESKAKLTSTTEPTGTTEQTHPQDPIESELQRLKSKMKPPQKGK